MSRLSGPEQLPKAHHVGEKGLMRCTPPGSTPRDKPGPCHGGLAGIIPVALGIGEDGTGSLWTHGNLEGPT